MENILCGKQQSDFRSFSRIMKCTILLFLCLVGILFPVELFSQTKKVSITVEDKTVEDVLNIIEKQTQYLFVYDVKEINPERRVSLRVEDETVAQVLDVIFKGMNVQYAMEGKNIMLMHKDGKGALVDKLSGVVKDVNGEPVIGANILIKGTTTGTITDLNGNFMLEHVPGNAVLQVSYIGYLSQDVRLDNRSRISITLRENNELLEEVVVVGYGVQKKKLVTGATVQIKGDDLQKLNTTSTLGALSSRMPGVSITANNGQPGEGFKVYVRGMGTIGNAEPLYVIDGVAGGDINALNPADIESIDVLKDAASAAIYGARAANGVILVTTKQGKAGRLQISYDAYWGWQYCYKMPELLNAQEYMKVQDMIRFNEGQSPIDWASLLPDYLYDAYMSGSLQGTNWLKEAYNKGAPVQNHAVNLTGGSETSKFSLGFSYTDQEGIFGTPVQSKYNRYTARINSEHILLKVNDFEAIKIGETLNFSSSRRSGVRQGSQYDNDMFNYLSTNPLLPMYDENGDYYDYDDMMREGYSWFLDNGNPIAAAALSDHGLNLTKNHRLQASAYLSIQPVKNLILKSQFGYKYVSSTYRSYNKVMHLNQVSNVPVESVYQSGNVGSSWTLDNTLTYKWEHHNHVLDVVLGQSLEKWGMGDSFSGSGSNTLFSNSWDHAWLGNTKPTNINEISVSGYPDDAGALASFFGRANYNYKETYMASFTLRADGSSNFSRGHRWGYFPSVSAGWVISNENWMEQSRNWIDFLKVRASWGQNGNCNIANFQYNTTYAFDASNGYFFGVDKMTQSVGGYAKILANPDVTWETSEQLDLGIDARFFNSRFGVTLDWYKKITKDWLVQAPILSTYGLEAPYINGGDVSNQGFEVALSWDDTVGNDFVYGLSLNLAYNKNRVTRIANSEGIIHGSTGATGALGHGAYEIYRAEVGYPIGYFYGYKTAGIFQNYAEIEAWREAGNGILQGNNVLPGDVKFVDLNHDGIINDADKTDIGNPIPDFTLGFNFNASYKGFDVALTANGAFGHQIAKSYRNVGGFAYQNFTTDVFDYWCGEGTSNKWPRLTSGGNINLTSFSSLYLENADYLRLQNLTIGYDFKKLCPGIPLSQVRLYFTAQNLFTITGYSGMDPEVGYGFEDSWASGIDIGTYPNPRTYMFGVNLKF